MAEHLDRIGQQIGEYLLLRWLGGGGFGNVYLAEQVRDHSLAAVKLLQIRLSHSEELKAFINEARTIRLKHPHIIPLLDFGISRQDIPFLVMEYAVQGTLRDRHPKGVQVPLTTVVIYVEQVASALLYAHEQRLIHRDVKPENMLLRADGTLLLSDFGIASVAHSSHSLHLQQGISGTIPYMAPEQIQGQARTASDQYSLGVVIYEWIAGRRPFEGTAVEVAMQHAMKPPPSLTVRVPTLSSAVDQVVLKALAKDPGDRFVTVQDFAVALGQAVQEMSHTFSSDTPHRSLPPAMPDMHGASPSGSSEQVLSPNPSISPTLSSSPNLPLVSPQVTSPHPTEPSLFPVRTEIDSPGQPTLPLSPFAHTGNSSVAGKPPQPIQRQPSQISPLPTISASPVQMPMQSVLKKPSSSISTSQDLHPSYPVFATQALAPRRTRRRNIPPWRVVVLAVLALTTISGGLFGYFFLRQHTGSSTTPQPTIHTTATVQTRATALAHVKPHLLWTFQTVPADHTLLAVFNGVVYVNSNAAMLYAIDTAGHKKWSYIPTSSSISGPLAVANGVVYVGSDSAHFYAVDAATGQQRWDFSTNDGPWYTTSGVVANGIVYIHALGSPFYAVDATSGKLQWSLPTSGPSNQANYSDPVVTDGVVYVSSSANDRLYAVDAVTGKQKWAFSFPLSAGDYSNLIVSNGVVYVADYDSGTFYAVDAVTGKQKWAFATKVNFNALDGEIVSGMVYLRSYIEGKLYALDTVTGKQEWAFSFSLNAGDYPGPSIVSDGMVYSYCRGLKLCALDAATGKQKWTSSISGHYGLIPSTPIVSDGVVYVVDNDDSNLYAVDATTGQQGWTFSIGGGSILTQQVLTDGVVYVCTEDGKLSAISIATGQ